MGADRSRGRGRAGWMAVLSALVAGGLSACQPLPPPEPGSVLIGCDQASTRLQVTTTSHLDPECTYAGIDVVASGVTLDCRNAWVRGALGAPGAGIRVRSPEGVALHDVTVRNCRVDGFVNGMRVTRDGFRSLAPGEEYEHTTARILIERSKVGGSSGVGIFVDGYVEDVTIRDNTVSGAGSSGVYLETGSRRNRVIHNSVIHNGFIQNGPSGQVTNMFGTDFYFWGIGREGISVDGSYENVIRDNSFANNSAGGIFLYKNCGEYPDRPAYFERRFPADRNLIEGNVFLGGTNGVWIGSRMGENTLPMDCTDPAYLEGPLQRVVLDHAADNVVVGNEFHGVTHAIRVEDDGNRIEANTFSGTGPDQHGVIVGTPHRTSVLDRPVSGTVVVDNVSTISNNPNPFRWVSAQVDSTLSGNTALGQPVGWCQAPEPPRGPFVFVVAVAVAGPGGTPPATTPDLSVPVLPALPAC